MKSYSTCICITHNGKRTHILWRPVDLHVRQTRYQVVLFPANPIHLCFWLLLKDVGSRSRIYPIKVWVSEKCSKKYSKKHSKKFYSLKKGLKKCTFLSTQKSTQ